MKTLMMTSRMFQASGGHSWWPVGKLGDHARGRTRCNEAHDDGRQTQDHHDKVEENVVATEDDAVGHPAKLLACGQAVRG